MLTERDRTVIIHVGLHGWLSHSQIQQLEFPSYDMTQRRLREELLPNNYLDRKYLSGKNNTRKAIFRLGRKGKKIYKADTGEKAKVPRFSQLKVPHRLMVNQLLIELKSREIICINEFELEKKCGTIRPDAYVYYPENNFCLEVDRSGGETKDFIQKKWKQYQREYMQGNLKTKYIVWSSNRCNQLHDYIKKVHQSRLKPIYINYKPKEILKVIEYLSGSQKVSQISR